MRAIHQMVRRRKIPEAGFQHHEEAAHDNTLAAASVPDRGGADKTEHRVNMDCRTPGEATEALKRTILDSYGLVADILTNVNSRQDKLIGKLETGTISRKEVEAEEAEIRRLRKEAKHLKEAAKMAQEKLLEYLENNIDGTGKIQ